jgi:hypothetical protein
MSFTGNLGVTHGGIFIAHSHGNGARYHKVSLIPITSEL